MTHCVAPAGCIDSLGRHRRLRVDASLIEELITANKPFRIETASGRGFDVPHRDFISFSPKKTAVFVSYEEDGRERFAIVPLLTVTAAISQASLS